uniref:hypothetical protein n=1 Tax=Thaumasiovibrio occultus TaxID=1891184 RepID=UPI00131B5C25
VLMIIGFVVLCIFFSSWQSDSISRGEDYAINIGRELQQDMKNGLGCSNTFAQLQDEHNAQDEDHVSFRYPNVDVYCYPNKGEFFVSVSIHLDYDIDSKGGVNLPLSLSSGYPGSSKNWLIDVETGQRIQQ